MENMSNCSRLRRILTSLEHHSEKQRVRFRSIFKLKLAKKRGGRVGSPIKWPKESYRNIENCKTTVLFYRDGPDLEPR